MKREFASVGPLIDSNSVYFLYGNFKRAFLVFCDFLIYKLQDVEPVFCSVSDFLISKSTQCSLFEERRKCFCIKDVEDKDLKKLEPFLDEGRDIFVLEAGDFFKSKVISDFFTKSPKFVALASFKNDMTLASLCKMLLPNCDRALLAEVMKLINNTDEELLSFFTKMSLLLEDSPDELQNYVIFKSEFLDELEPIPFLRCMASMLLKYKLYNKNYGNVKIDFDKPGLMRKIIQTEIKYKSGMIANQFEFMQGGEPPLA